MSTNTRSRRPFGRKRKTKKAVFKVPYTESPSIQGSADSVDNTFSTIQKRPFARRAVTMTETDPFDVNFESTSESIDVDDKFEEKSSFCDKSLAKENQQLLNKKKLFVNKKGIGKDTFKINCNDTPSFQSSFDVTTDQIQKKIFKPSVLKGVSNDLFNINFENSAASISCSGEPLNEEVQKEKSFMEMSIQEPNHKADSIKDATQKSLSRYSPKRMQNDSSNIQSNNNLNFENKDLSHSDMLQDITSFEAKKKHSTSSKGGDKVINSNSNTSKVENSFDFSNNENENENENRPFKRQHALKEVHNDPFNVNFDSTIASISADDNIKTSQDKSEVVAKKKPFERKKRIYKGAFQVVGHNSPSLQNSFDFSTDKIEKRPFKKPALKKLINDSFVVNPENTVSNFSIGGTNLKDNQFQNLTFNETLSQERNQLLSKKKPFGNKNKKNPKNSFNVTNTDSPSMQSFDVTGTETGKRPFKVPNLKEICNDTFNLNPDNTVASFSEGGINLKDNPLENSPFNEPLSQGNNQLLAKKKPFGNKNRKGNKDPFNVTSNDSSSMQSFDVTSNGIRKKPFGKSILRESPFDPFSVSAENTVANISRDSIFLNGKNASNTILSQDKNSDSIAKDQSDEVRESESPNFHGMVIINKNINNITKESESRNASGTTSPENRNSATPNRNEATPNRNEATQYEVTCLSFNDENLNEWMSDASSESPEKTQNQAIMNANLQPNTEQEQSSSSFWERKLQQIMADQKNDRSSKETCNKPKSKGFQLRSKPQELAEAKKTLGIYKKPKLSKPAPFATKRLYQYIIKCLEPDFGIDATVRAEELIISICDTVKIVSRRKEYQKKLIDDLKYEMAKLKVIETTYDFYEFVRNFLPAEFRKKVIPCIQPLTNAVWPPKDTRNPFDKILG